MEIVDERNVKEIALSELGCGDLFTTRDCEIFYMKTAREKRNNNVRFVECINIENGGFWDFELDDYIIPIEAKVVLT